MVSKSATQARTRKSHSIKTSRLRLRTASISTFGAVTASTIAHLAVCLSSEPLKGSDETLAEEKTEQVEDEGDEEQCQADGEDCPILK